MSSLEYRNVSVLIRTAMAIAVVANHAEGNPTAEAFKIGGARTYVNGYTITDADEASIFTPAGFAKPGQPVRIEGKDVGQLRLIVRDESTGKPTFCRVNVVGSDGNYYQPRENELTEYGLTLKFDTNRPDGMPRGNRRTPPIRYFGRFFYSPGDTTVNVKPGPVRIEVWKGFEYDPTTVATRIERGLTRTVEVTIRRTMPMAEHGYYSGDPHIHIPRHTPDDDEKILDLMEAEDINFGAILAFNLPPGRYEGEMNKQWTPQANGLGRSSIRTRGAYNIMSGQEYRSQTYGHLNLYMRDGIVLPGQSTRNDDWPLYGDVGRETQKLGGYAFYAHGGYAQAIYADFVQGNVNGTELLLFGIYFGLGLDDWYHILNSGYRFPITGACDWPYCRALGDTRTYAEIDGKPDFAAWLQGAAAGRSFVTSGPMLLFEVDGKKPGDCISKSGSGPHRVTARIRVRSEVAPVSHVQLIVNGKAVEEVTVPVEQRTRSWVTLEYPIDLTESSWIAARSFSKTDAGAPNAEAHTNPVYVYLDGKAPYRQASLDQIVAGIDRQILFHKSREFDKKTDVLAYFDRSRDILMMIRAAGGAPSQGNPWDIANDEHAMLKSPGARLHSDDELKEFLKPIPAKTPEQAQQSMETIPGFQLDLVAHEPLVCDPVAAEFDENGQLYVCEMLDYPYRPKPAEKPLGTVRLLRDTNGDGVFDDSHVFADGLLWASGIVPWKGGVYVASAPDIWYLKDTNGDFKADVRTKVFTGFGTQNQQAMLNNLKHGPDHMIYGSTGPNGGSVRAVDEGNAQGVSVSGRDFRFNPETLRFETITGTVQFGNSFDDWGNRFLCHQSRPIFHEVLPQHYLARNPHLPVPSAINNLAEGGPVPIYRTSPTERWRQIRSNRLIANELRDASQSDVSQYVIDAAAGVTIYRGAAYPKSFYGNAFIGDAQNNLVHRRTLIPDGPTFKSERADENTEFVRSADNWFRPVNFLNAPDGTLWLLDMSREIIESNNIPMDVAKHLDLKRGRDQGRIYRIAPAGFKHPPPPRLGEASTAELVATLENPNGWWRDTAHRLIYERQDISCVPALRSLLDKSAMPQARLLALWSLKGLDELSDSDVERSLIDSVPEVREHAIRLAESRLDSSPNILERVLSQSDETNPRVCLQLAFTLGEAKDPRATAVLAKIVSKNASNQWIRAAVLSSVATTADRLFSELLVDAKFADSNEGTSLLTELAGIVGARGRTDEVSNILGAIGQQEKRTGIRSLQEAVVLGLGSGMKRSGSSLPEPDALPPASAKLLSAMFARAETTAIDETRSSGDRAHSIRLLGCRDFEKVQPTLTRLLAQAEPQDVQLATLDVLAEYSHSAIATLVISGLAEYSPSVAARAIRLLLSRSEWTEKYLAAISDGHLPSAQIDVAARTKLLEHQTDSIRRAAQKLFSNSPRDAVIANYHSILQRPGDPSRGEGVFKRECAACHKVRNEGFEVGPDLASSPSRDVDALLTNILDPNRFVDPAHIQYVIVDQSGRTFNGKIIAETATSVTLTSGKGVQETILRKDIDQFVSTGKSLMPEGFENTISKDEMADLLAFLNGLEGTPGTVKPALVQGTRPGAVEP